MENIDVEWGKCILKGMIQINTVNPPGNEELLSSYINDLLIKEGIKSEVVTLGGNRANLIAELKGEQEDAILLNGHLDTVPVGEVKWEFDPFTGIEKDGYIYGRGASDMKGGIASMLMAIKALKNINQRHNTVILALTAGEEVDSIGAKHFVENYDISKIKGIIIGEPSDNEVNIAEKGALWVEITVFGKTAHGAFPEQGINAIWGVKHFLDWLESYTLSGEHPLLGKATSNLATINGGIKTNVVPDSCTVTVDFRTIPSISNDKILEDIIFSLNEIERRDLIKYDLKIINDRPSVELEMDHSLVKLCCEENRKIKNKVCIPHGVSFYTDASVFVPTAHIPTIYYGPGEAEMAHKPNEYVSIKNMEEASKFYIEVINRFQN